MSSGITLNAAMQCRLSNVITSTRNTVAKFLASQMDSIKGMLPTCQS